MADIGEQLDRIEQGVHATNRQLEKLEERHGQLLEAHGRTLEAHGRTLEAHGRTLEAHGQTLDRHGEILTKISKDVEHLSGFVKLIADDHEARITALEKGSALDRHTQEEH